MRFCVAILVVTLAGCLDEASPGVREGVFAQYIEAVNGNAVGAALSHHTRDAEFLIPGQTPIVGTDAMRSLLQWDSVLDSRIRFDPGHWIGDTLVVGEGMEVNAWFQGIGLDSILYAGGTRFVFDGDKISGVYPSELQPESMAEFGVKYGAFLTWMGEHAPEGAGLAPDGQFIYTAEMASQWLHILSRYGEHQHFDR